MEPTTNNKGTLPSTNQPSANQPTPKAPFWQPWGAWGCLWRTLVMLAGFALITFLIGTSVKGCNHNSDPLDSTELNIDTTLLDQDDQYDIPPALRDSSLVDDWNDSIPGVDELPDPDDNFIPPIDSTHLVANPEDSLSVIIDDQLIVLINSQNIKRDMASFAKKFKQVYPDDRYEITYYNPLSGTMLLNVPPDNLIKVANELPDKIPDIDFAVDLANVIAETSRPSDSGFSNASYDEYFRLIQAYDAWEITKGSPDVKVAIVDSYFDLTHPEIGERYVDRIHIPTKSRMVLPPQLSELPKTNDQELFDAIGNYSHGTHVAGCAIGAQNNRIGCSGIAPECSWIPISIADPNSSGGFHPLDVIDGILYAAYHDADVVNASLGRQFSEFAKYLPLKTQVDYAKKESLRGEKLWNYIVKVLNDHNCVFVTASGNETILTGMDPMNRNPYIIRVEAVDAKGIASNFTNFGKVPEYNVDYSTVAAPGVSIWNAIVCRYTPLFDNLVNKYSDFLPFTVSKEECMMTMDGTSMASPIVAGAVALLKSKNKDLTAEQIIDILVSTGKQTDRRHRIGPTIQLRAALDATSDGERLNYDDLMKNHDLLIGKWKSTKTLSLVDEATRKELDKHWQYFIFPNTTSGTTEFHTLNTKRIYVAGLVVSWQNQSISIQQNGPAKSRDGELITKDDYVCRPSKNRELEVSCMRNGKERFKFYLEKVN